MIFSNELTAGGTTMSYTSGLSARVAAAALVTFSASWFLSSPAAHAQNAKSTAADVAAAVHKPVYIGDATGSGVGPVIAQIVHGLKAGGVVVVFSPPPDGDINAYAISGTGVTVRQKDETGDNMWHPDSPPTPSTTLGDGYITDIAIYKGSDCVRINLNGQWIAVCK
jgi:hypothetical protein